MEVSLLLVCIGCALFYTWRVIKIHTELSNATTTLKDSMDRIINKQKDLERTIDAKLRMAGKYIENAQKSGK